MEPEAIITNALAKLQASVPGVTAALLASTEGRVLGTTLTAAIPRMRLSATSAASLAVARKGSHDVEIGDLASVHIAGRHGSILLLSVGQKAVLSLVLADQVTSSSVLEAATKALPKLESLL